MINFAKEISAIVDHTMATTINEEVSRYQESLGANQEMFVRSATSDNVGVTALLHTK